MPRSTLEMLAHRRLPEGTEPNPLLGLLALCLIIAVLLIAF